MQWLGKIYQPRIIAYQILRALSMNFLPSARKIWHVNQWSLID